MIVRLLVVAVLVVGVVGLAVWYRRRAEADGRLGGSGWPRLDDSLLDATHACTWVVFTTPWCASCRQVEAEIARHLPHHAVRVVDATESVEVADRYEVKRAPTTLLADREGTILERLVGAEAVVAFIGDADVPAADLDAGTSGTTATTDDGDQVRGISRSV